MKMAADDIETYAKKHGGIDKKDMMKAASMLKKGDKKGALKFIKNLDTDPRDYLLKTMGEEVEIDEHCGECGAMDHAEENLNEADYELYHKTFSAAMQHAYAHAKKRGFIVDPDEIDNKVATGPKKPSSGKTNKYILGTNKKQKLHVQVANLDNKRYELNMYIEETEKENMNIEETIKQVVEGRTKKEDASNDKSDDGDGMDKVDPKAVKKKFKDRKDKDIDNDGDTDSTDKYLHKRRKAISKAIDQEDDEEQKEDHSPAQDTVKGKGSSKDKKPLAKYEETDSPLYAQVKKLLRNK